MKMSKGNEEGLWMDGEETSFTDAVLKLIRGVRHSRLLTYGC